MNGKEPKILLFDGLCNMCNGLVQWILRVEKGKSIMFSALQSDSGQVLLDHFNLNKTDFDSLIYIEGNEYYSKSTAALKIFVELGGIWRFFGILKILPRPLRDWFYDIIAKYRYRLFGKRLECMVPDREVQFRFLD